LRESIFIRPAATGNSASWCLQSPNTGFSGIQQGSLEDGLNFCTGRRVILVVPAADVSFTVAEVPARLASGAAAKIQRAIPYVLEERLADDVETLHFAIGRRFSGNHIPVAIVSRSRMEGWLEPFRARGMTPALVVADLQCLPLLQDGGPAWPVLVEQDRVTVRSGEHSGFACDVGMLRDFIAMSQPPDGLQLQAFPAGLAEGTTPSLGDLGVTVQAMRPVRDGLECLLRGFNEASAINLMQGDYAAQSDYAKWLQPWRATAAMLVLWLVLGVIALGLEYARLNHERAVLDRAAEASLRAAFPQVTRVVDVRAQAQQQLAILHRSGGNLGFLGLLQGVSAILARNPTLKLQEIQFREGTMVLALEAADIAALDGFQQSFSTQPGLAFEVQSANAGSQGVQIRVKVKARA
jgi:general secretion pathway protein L